MTAPMAGNASGRLRARMGGRREPTQQVELFGDERTGILVGTPAWQDLPAATQAVLTSLMARLILEHAETRRDGSRAETGHDL